jgi:hypothetical protein
MAVPYSSPILPFPIPRLTVMTTTAHLNGAALQSPLQPALRFKGTISDHPPPVIPDICSIEAQRLPEGAVA